MLFLILPALLLNYLIIGLFVLAIQAVNSQNGLEVDKAFKINRTIVLLYAFGWPAMVSNVVAERAKQNKKS